MPTNSLVSFFPAERPPWAVSWSSEDRESTFASCSALRAWNCCSPLLHHLGSYSVMWLTGELIAAVGSCLNDLEHLRPPHLPLLGRHLDLAGLPLPPQHLKLPQVWSASNLWLSPGSLLSRSQLEQAGAYLEMSQCCFVPCSPPFGQLPGSHCLFLHQPFWD